MVGTELADNGTFLAGLTQARVLAIIRGRGAEPAVAAALALFEEGIRHVEVALTTPGALQAIEAIRAQAPEGAAVGAGTVLTGADVSDVVAAGGQFIVTPAVAEPIPEAVRRDMPVLAGALTPTEAHNAMRLGAAAVKLFPASVGGPGYLRALRDPFPGIPFLAVGGVDLELARGYLQAGAVGVGVGGPLVGDAAAGGDLAEMRRRARGFVQLAAEFGAAAGA